MDYGYIHIFVVKVMNKIIKDMEKVGQYHYDIRFNHFNVYVCTSVSNNGMTASFHKVAEFRDREEARRYTWKMNGWGEPKSPLTRKF